MNYTENQFNEAMAGLDDVKRCPRCPHVIGDITERDCAFPDCYPDYYNDLNYLMPLAWKCEIDVARFSEDEGIDNTVTEYGWCAQDNDLRHCFTVSGHDPLPAIRDILFELSQERKV